MFCGAPKRRVGSPQIKNFSSFRILDELEPVLADNPERLLGVVAMQAITNAVSYSLVTALEKERKMNELLREVPESPYVVSVSAFMGHLSRWRGDYKKAIEILEPVLPRMKEMSSANVYLHGLFFYGLALGETGRLQEAIHVLKDGRDFGINSGEGYSTPKVTNSIGWAYHELCQYQKAIHYNQLSLELVRETFGPGTSKLYEIESQANLNLGENYLALGDLQQAADFLESVYEKREHPDYFFSRTRWKSRCLLDMGQLELRRGNPAKAQALLGELREDGWSEKFSFKKYQVRAGRLQGNIFSAQGKDKEAEVEFTVREALHTRAFWQLALAMSLAQLTTSALTVHMIPALESFDISTGLAGFVVMFVALTSIIGRLGGGILGDYIDKRYVLAVSLAALVAGTLMFARITSVWYLIPFILLYGIGFGGSIPVRFALMGDYFGRRSFGSLLGITMTINVVFGVVAPVFAGWMFDVADSYRPAFIILGLLALAAPPLMLSIRRPTLKQRI